MMKQVALCLVLLGVRITTVSCSQVIEEEFKIFKLQYGKKYANPTEEEYRMKIYGENREKISLHNQLYHQGLVNYTMGVNKFGDMLHGEIIEMMAGYKNSNKGLRGGSTFLRPSHVVLPDKVDWRKEGYVTPVKDQGDCGSCWAFSATGSLEGQHFRKTGKLVQLSEQNLVDCTRTLGGNHGCKGGRMDRSFDYVKVNGGIDTEQSYQYKAVDEKCHYNAETVGATDTGYIKPTSGSEKALQEAVATVGPISIAIDIGWSFVEYTGGVYYEPDCSSSQLNHAVLVVGYDTDAKGGDYWIVKNSWGDGWGDSGYIKMARNRDNMCGVATEAIYPLV